MGVRGSWLCMCAMCGGGYVYAGGGYVSVCTSVCVCAHSWEGQRSLTTFCIGAE